MDENILKLIFPFYEKAFRIDQEKKRIRFDIRQMKDELNQEQKEKEAEMVFKKIESMEEFKTANTILIYWSTGDELPTQTAIYKWSNEKILVLPTVKGDKLKLKVYDQNVKMVQRALGIYEPDLPETYTGKIDLAIVPGVAFDFKKNRLGRGKGFYDRYFRKNKILKIGVGFDLQLLYSVPARRFDKRMDKIITPSNTIE